MQSQLSHGERNAAYLRAVELVDAIEVDARDRMGGRLFASIGPWAIPTEVLKHHLAAMLWNVRIEPGFDKWMLNYLVQFSHAPDVIRSPVGNAPAPGRSRTAAPERLRGEYAAAGYFDPNEETVFGGFGVGDSRNEDRSDEERREVDRRPSETTVSVRVTEDMARGLGELLRD